MIRIRHFVVGLLVLVAAVACLLSTHVATPQDRGESLHDRMEAVNRSMRSLRRSVADAAQNSATLTTLESMQAQFAACKAITPEQVSKEQDEAKRTELARTYRLQICKVQRALMDIEIAVLEGRNADAVKLVSGLKDLEHDSHKKLGVDD